MREAFPDKHLRVKHFLSKHRKYILVIPQLRQLVLRTCLGQIAIQRRLQRQKRKKNNRTRQQQTTFIFLAGAHFHFFIHIAILTSIIYLQYHSIYNQQYQHEERHSTFKNLLSSQNPSPYTWPPPAWRLPLQGRGNEPLLAKVQGRRFVSRHNGGEHTRRWGSQEACGDRYTYTLTHIHTYTYTLIHTYTHTYIHIQICSSLPVWVITEDVKKSST